MLLIPERVVGFDDVQDVVNNHETARVGSINVKFKEVFHDTVREPMVSGFRTHCATITELMQI